MSTDLFLRDVTDDDLPVFFEQQLDEEANHIAAFTAKDPANREAFMAHWRRILMDETVILQTILVDGQVAGSVMFDLTNNWSEYRRRYEEWLEK